MSSSLKQAQQRNRQSIIGRVVVTAVVVLVFVLVQLGALLLHYFNGLFKAPPLETLTAIVLTVLLFGGPLLIMLFDLLALKQWVHRLLLRYFPFALWGLLITGIVSAAVQPWWLGTDMIDLHQSRTAYFPNPWPFIMLNISWLLVVNSSRLGMRRSQPWFWWILLWLPFIFQILLYSIMNNITRPEFIG